MLQIIPVVSSIIMKTLFRIIIIMTTWSTLSCKGKKTTTNIKPLLLQDTTYKKASQINYVEKTDFDYSDFHYLENNKNYDRFLAGHLNVPTGQIVCTDPMYRELGFPQSWTIDKGQYPVYIYIGLDGDFAGRIAYAELVVKDEIPDSWEISLIPEHFLADSFELKMNGMYPVENGLSCFADFETYKLYDKLVRTYEKADSSNNFYNDKLEYLFRQNQNLPISSRGEDWVNYKLEGTNRNIIMFGSGYGDGLYPRYVGYDKKGSVVKLVTDFIQLKSSETK